jgi:hypothetical protein
VRGWSAAGAPKALVWDMELRSKFKRDEARQLRDSVSPTGD